MKAKHRRALLSLKLSYPQMKKIILKELMLESRKEVRKDMESMGVIFTNVTRQIKQEVIDGQEKKNIKL